MEESTHHGGWDIMCRYRSTCFTPPSHSAIVKPYISFGARKGLPVFFLGVSVYFFSPSRPYSLHASPPSLPPTCTQPQALLDSGSLKMASDVFIHRGITTFMSF